jgi:pimeloyl-ACP methyl ester carboxylesterase
VRQTLTGSGALVFAACVLAGSATSASAQAQPAEPTFKRCGFFQFARCGEVPVPLDRSGRVPGTVQLHVRRVPTPGATRGAVFALAGGPGQAATPFAESDAAKLLRGLDGREIVTFDQRGTGRSGALRCPTLEGLSERLVNVGGAAADCAETLGPRRAFYTTRDSVEDLEAVRRAIGVDKVTLYGVSYGTKLALAYAAAYPAHVDRLLLDSIVGTDGPDPFARDALGAVPRVLRQLCGNRCKAFTPDPGAELSALVSRLSSGLLRGPLVRDDGRAYPARLSRIRLLDLLFAGDFDPTLRAALPGAVHSALTGDPAPILRLARTADRVGEEPVSYFSPGLFAATTCEEGPLPWSRTSPVTGRLDEGRGMLAGTPDAALTPFDRLTTFTTSVPVQMCRQWPTAVADPGIPNGPFPPVPALLIAGEDDLRTPLENARAVAPRLPQARVLAIPDAGHSALDWPSAGCARTAARDFLLGRAVQGCPRKPRFVPLEPIAPMTLSQLEPARAVRGQAGRTLTAIRRTLEDMSIQFVSALFGFGPFRVSIGGLRGGTMSLKNYGLRLDQVVYVPGVTVSGELRGDRLSRGFVRVTGQDVARGRLRLRHGRLSGRLGGRRVAYSLPPEVLGGEEKRVERREKRGSARVTPLERTGHYPLLGR